MPGVTLPRRIDYLPLDGLTPARRNPKEHDLPGIAGAIRRLGFTSAAVLDERTGRLVAGHGRTAALRRIRDAGDPPPSGVTLGPAGEWLVPVQRGWASATDHEAEAMLVADNHLSTAGGWDNRALTEMLEDLAVDTPDLLDATGYTADDLDRLLASVRYDADGEGTGPADSERPARTCPHCGRPVG